MTNKEKNFISAVVYLHNNENAISYFMECLYKTLGQNFEKFEIICVNDASTDNVVAALKELKISGAALSVVNMSFYQGPEAAMNAGLDLAIGDLVYEFDTNLIDYDPKLIMEIYFRSLEGYDIVSAANQFKSRFLSKLFYKLYNNNAHSQYKVNSETFRILSRRAINRVRAMSKTAPYRKAAYANCGLKTDSLEYAPVTKIKIPAPKNKYDTALNSLILFTNVAYKAAIALAVLMALAAAEAGIYALAVFFLQQPVPGFTTMMFVITGSFFGVFLILAIIIKYLSVIVDLVFKRKEYVIESVEKL